MKPNHESASQRYTLNCRMNQEAAALERLCRVVRVRGFRISRMAMESTGDTLDIALTLEGSRPVAMLFFEWALTMNWWSIIVNINVGFPHFRGSNKCKTNEKARRNLSNVGLSSSKLCEKIR